MDHGNMLLMIGVNKNFTDFQLFYIYKLFYINIKIKLFWNKKDFLNKKNR